jgi:hypothetical protein
MPKREFKIISWGNSEIQENTDVVQRNEKNIQDMNEKFTKDKQ